MDWAPAHLHGGLELEAYPEVRLPRLVLRASGDGEDPCRHFARKKNLMDIYRVDLSIIVSKYIGEMEKNLAKVLDLAGASVIVE